MKPTVYMMLGLPGSGKTTFSKKLQSKLGLVRFSLDEEYSKLGGDLHDKNWDKQLAAKAGELIKSQTARLVCDNQSVILDLCPWVKSRRDEYRDFINTIGAECHVFYFDIEKEELLRRLHVRNKSGEDSHIISPEMLDDFIEEFDSPVNEQIEIVS